MSVSHLGGFIRFPDFIVVTFLIKNFKKIYRRRAASWPKAILGKNKMKNLKNFLKFLQFVNFDFSSEK